MLFSIWTAFALLSLAACEFHAEAGSPPATPSSTPAATTAPATPAVATPAPTSTVPPKTNATGHMILHANDGGA
ncbi:MAG: hypothetical protein ACREJX_12135 [Polyangiaceae bacterium]